MVRARILRTGVIGRVAERAVFLAAGDVQGGGPSGFERQDSGRAVTRLAMKPLQVDIFLASSVYKASVNSGLLTSHPFVKGAFGIERVEDVISGPFFVDIITPDGHVS